MSVRPHRQAEREEENARDMTRLPGEGTGHGSFSKETEFALRLESALHAERPSRGGSENTAPDQQSRRNF